MNNFVFNGNDPLLYNTLSSPMQRQVPPEIDLRQQLDNAFAQYQQAQNNLTMKQEHIEKDYLGELDDILKELDENIIEKLQANTDFITLHNEIQQMIQNEIMKSVRWKLNSNQEAINKIESIKRTIRNTQKEVQAEEKKNMMELNDYIANYSSMSFDEYKKIKSGK